MADKDFFDQEFDKLSQQQSEQQTPTFDQWYQRSTQNSNGNGSSNKKPLFISLICVSLVLCIFLGWILCALFSSKGNEQQQLLDTVVRYLDEQFYLPIEDEETWTKGIESAGTALLQQAGDRYSRLLSPQTFYDYMHPQSAIDASPQGYFGFSYSPVEGVGMLVVDIASDSNSYGLLQLNDMIVKMSNIVDANGNDGVTLDGQVVSEVVLSQLSSNAISAITQRTQSATFYVLRNGETFSVSLSRAPLYRNANYNYDFVEFYFKDAKGLIYTNVSTDIDAINANCDTEDARLLTNLPKNTGYVRIVEFTDTVTSKSNEEFKQVMDLFKQLGLTRLVLDLKGNPGGNVEYVSDVAGMLIDVSALTDAQLGKVKDNQGRLLITRLESRDGTYSTEYRASTYSEYFAPKQNGKCNIVVWTDGSSASASELLTGALLDYQTAIQMGSCTYGKGIAQACIPLNYFGNVVNLEGNVERYNWAIYFTFARYFSPLGTNIHGKGYAPQGDFDGLESYQQLWEKTLQYWNE